jgi:pimeloyl-ACP methyl ester carboxylesterase
MHHVRHGSGRPLLLLHGLGGSHRSWDTVKEPLAAQRELIIPDLPGFGETPPVSGLQSFAALTDEVERFIDSLGHETIDVAGSSMGARMALELLRRGRNRNTVALDPGGFWSPREATVFHGSIRASIKLVKAIRPALPVLASNPATRTALLGQFSARPWALDRRLVLQELQSIADSPAAEPVLDELARGPRQAGLPAGAAPGRIVIGWGRRDLVTIPRQAARAQKAFPDARLHWFDRCGHFPMWDQPDPTAQLILETTAG